MCSPLLNASDRKSSFLNSCNGEDCCKPSANGEKEKVDSDGVVRKEDVEDDSKNDNTKDTA